MVDSKVVTKYLGIPYKHGGRNLDGVDCLGLIHLFLKEHGVEIPPDDGFAIHQHWYKENSNRFVEGLSKYADEVPYERRKALDIAVFEIQSMPVHAAVIVDYLKFIHIMEGRKVVLGKFSKWRNRVYKIFRVKGGE